MTITFKNDNDVIVYVLEKIISYARENQYIFLAQSIWWIASIIGLQQGLVIHIANLKSWENITSDAASKATSVARTNRDQKDTEKVHPNRIGQIDNEWEISVTPRDLAEDQRLDNILDNAERFLASSGRARNQWQLNRVNPLPQTKKQLRKNRRTKHLQKARNKAERNRQQRLKEIRAEVTWIFSEE